jgi:hypothetical protein
MGQKDSEHNYALQGHKKSKAGLVLLLAQTIRRQGSAMQTGGAVSEKVEVESPVLCGSRKQRQ